MTDMAWHPEEEGLLAVASDDKYPQADQTFILV